MGNKWIFRFGARARCKDVAFAHSFVSSSLELDAPRAGRSRASWRSTPSTSHARAREGARDAATRPWTRTSETRARAATRGRRERVSAETRGLGARGRGRDDADADDAEKPVVTTTAREGERGEDARGRRARDERETGERGA